MHARMHVYARMQAGMCAWQRARLWCPRSLVLQPLHSCGPYSYGPHLCRQRSLVAYVVMPYIVMAHVYVARDRSCCSPEVVVLDRHRCRAHLSQLSARACGRARAGLPEHTRVRKCADICMRGYLCARTFCHSAHVAPDHAHARAHARTHASMRAQGRAPSPSSPFSRLPSSPDSSSADPVRACPCISV